MLRIGYGVSDSAVLLTGWKYHEGDNSFWANAAYNDDDWEDGKFETTDISDFIHTHTSVMGWFRLKFIVPASVRSKSWSLTYDMVGVSELYLNGQSIMTRGVLDKDPEKVKAESQVAKPFTITLSNDSVQVLAVRFILQKDIPYIKQIWSTNMIVSYIGSTDALIKLYDNTHHNFAFIICYFVTGVFFVLFILHICFYLYYPKIKYNFYYAIFTLLTCLAFILAPIMLEVTFIEPRMWLTFFYRFLVHIYYVFYLLTIYSFFNYNKRIVFKILLSLTVVSVPLIFYMKDIIVSNILLLLQLLYLLEAFRIVWPAQKAKREGTAMMLKGIVIYLILYLPGIYFLSVGADNVKTLEFASLLLLAGVVTNSVMMSMAFGLRIANTNVVLRQKLIEVETLSKEKQEILTQQNKILEQQVIIRTSELKHSLEHLQSTQSQLIQSEKMASLGELTAGIAHEIQNPLNFVNNFSEVNKELIDEMQQEMDKGNYIDAKEISNDIKDNEEKINHHGKRADAIVKGMLQHSRSSTGHKQPSDINSLCDEYLRLCYHGIVAKDKSFNATLKTDFDESLGNINIVPQDIGRVILNILTNAFYAVNEKQKAPHGLKGGKEYEPLVTVTTRRSGSPLGDGGKIEVSVKDNGNGIPQKVLNKIFQPFFTTKPTGQGTGLGLSLAYDIVKAHGGEIKVESKEGEGTEFIIQLPAV